MKITEEDKSMSTYILVSFWTIVLAFILNAGVLMKGEFPVIDRHGPWFYVAALLIRIPILIWGAYLLWGGA